MTDELALATEFPPATQAEWRKLVDAALKGASFDKKLVSQTYDGLRIEPLYPRAAGASSVAGRTPGTPWTLMQRVDHPDPVAANKQVLEDLMNGATGLTLVFAGSLNANGYGLDASPATLDRTAQRRRRARRRYHHRLQRQPGDPRRRATVCRAGERPQAGAGLGRSASRVSIRLAASLRPAPARCRGASCRKYLPAGVRDLADQGFPRPVRGCRRAHHPQCRRFGSARTRLCHCRRRGLPARACKRPACRSMRRAARSISGCRPMPTNFSPSPSSAPCENYGRASKKPAA